VKVSANLKTFMQSFGGGNAPNAPPLVERLCSNYLRSFQRGFRLNAFNFCSVQKARSTGGIPRGKWSV